MTSDYISKQKACEALDDLAAYYDHKIHQPIISNGIEIARTKLSNMSTADGEPVVHCDECIYGNDCKRYVNIVADADSIRPVTFCSAGIRKP